MGYASEEKKTKDKESVHSFNKYLSSTYGCQAPGQLLGLQGPVGSMPAPTPVRLPFWYMCEGECRTGWALL